MLNKKAIAAFAAGATLLSGLAVAAPALAETAKETAKPATAQAAPKADNTEAVNVAKKKLSDAQKKQRKAESELDDANDALTAAKDKDAKVQAEVNKAKAAADAKTAADDKAKASLKAVKALAKEDKALDELEPKTANDPAFYTALKTAQDDAKAYTEADKAATEAENAAKAEIEKINADLKKDSTKELSEESTTAVATAQNDVYVKQGKLTAAEAAVKTAQDEIDKLVAPAPKPEPKKEDPKKEDPKKEDPKKEDPKKEDPKKEDPKKTDPKKEEPGKVVLPKTKEELKAYVEQVKAALKAEKDAKKAEAVKAALAEFGKAAKAKDKAAFAAALKKLLGLVPYTTAKKPEPKKSALEELLDPESVTTTTPFGTNTLFTNYKGLYVELLAHGLTNVRAYNVLLDKLEYGLHNGGWENIIKNFPEHDSAVENTCDFLASLRAQLRKAVKHYEHVQAAVKDIKVELKADYDEALAQHRWDDVKAIESKMAQAGSLYGVANSNRTRAVALLDSANDHAAELRCDTQAQDVRNAMDKEPNSPFKPAPAPAPKPAPKTPKAPKLPNTGAVVALAAVAASVLAGMGAALRKIRH